jgi:hypothetical protein
MAARIIMIVVKMRVLAVVLAEHPYRALGANVLSIGL